MGLKCFWLSTFQIDSVFLFQLLFKLGKSCQSHKPSLSSIVPFIPLSHTYTSDPHYQADPHRDTHCISLSHSHSHSIYIIYALFGMLLILSTSHLLYITHQLSRYQYHTFALPENHQFATFYVLSLYTIHIFSLHHAYVLFILLKYTLSIKHTFSI